MDSSLLSNKLHFIDMHELWFYACAQSVSNMNYGVNKCEMLHAV